MLDALSGNRIAVWSALIFFLIGALFAVRSIHDEISLDMRSDIQDAGKVVDEVAGEVTTILLRADFLEVAPCSSTGLLELRRIVLDAVHVRDIGIFKQGNMICTTALGVLEQPFTAEIPDYYLSLNFEAWLSPSLLGSRLLRSIVLKQGDANVVLDPRHFQAIPDSRNYQTAVLLNPLHQLPVIISGTLPPELDLRHLPLENSVRLQFLTGYYVASRCSPGFEACVVGVRKITNEYLTRSPRILVYGVLAAICSLVLLAVTTIQVKRHMFGVARLQREENRQRLILHYQPIVELTSGAITGAEALVRYRQKGQKADSAAEVLSWVNSTPASNYLAKFVIRKSIEELQFFLAKAPTNFLSLNVEINDIHADGFVEQLVNSCQKHQVKHDQILIEITEREEWDVDVTRDQMAMIKQLGFRIAVDDFGTGYANLSLVGHPHADVIKIDRLLMNYCISNDVVKEVVKGVAEAVHTVNKRVIMEGIETKDQVDFLKENLPYCMVQGYLYGKPLPADDWS